jgi:hypothetical protein
MTAEDPRDVERSDQLPEEAPGGQVEEDGGRDDAGERAGREQQTPPEPDRPATGNPHDD